MHDYFSGMICLRDGGTQMPDMVRRYSNKGVFTVYNIFLSVLLLLVGAVFIYTPGDIAATQVFGFSGAVNDPTTWIIYGVIFVYYLIATVFPIDAIIGRIYPIFAPSCCSPPWVCSSACSSRNIPLLNLWDDWHGIAFDAWAVDAATGEQAAFSYGQYFDANHFIPIFFITVACGILSGFTHADRYHLPHHEERAAGPHDLLQYDGPRGLHRHDLSRRRHGCTTWACRRSMPLWLPAPSA